MPSVLEETLGKDVVCRVPDIMHSANIKHSALSLFPVVNDDTKNSLRQEIRAEYVNDAHY